MAEIVSQVIFKKPFSFFAVQHLPEMTDKTSQFALQTDDKKKKKLNILQIEFISALLTVQVEKVI